MGENICKLISPPKSISKIFDIEFHNIKRNDIDLGGDINLQMISPIVPNASNENNNTKKVL